MERIKWVDRMNNEEVVTVIKIARTLGCDVL